jgi:hypothetical protein
LHGDIALQHLLSFDQKINTAALFLSRIFVFFPQLRSYSLVAARTRSRDDEVGREGIHGRAVERGHLNAAASGTQSNSLMSGRQLDTSRRAPTEVGCVAMN